MVMYFQKKVMRTGDYVYKPFVLNFCKTYAWAFECLVQGPSLDFSKKFAPKINKKEFEFLAFLPSHLTDDLIYNFENSFGDFSFESELLMMNFLRKNTSLNNVIVFEEWILDRRGLKCSGGGMWDRNFGGKIMLNGDDFYCYENIFDENIAGAPSKLLLSTCPTCQGFLLSKDSIDAPQEIDVGYIEYLVEYVVAVIFFGVYAGDGCVAVIRKDIAKI